MSLGRREKTLSVQVYWLVSGCAAYSHGECQSFNPPLTGIPCVDFSTRDSRVLITTATASFNLPAAKSCEINWHSYFVLCRSKPPDEAAEYSGRVSYV